MTGDRPNWDEVWMDVAESMASRSKCVRAQVGCVLVSPDQRVVSSGYNGPPAGYPAEGPCSGWCPRAMKTEDFSPTYDDCCSCHSEVNALIRADSKSLVGGTAYVTSALCKQCAKAVANSGLSRVVHKVDIVLHSYRGIQETEEFLALCGIEVLRA